MTSAEPRLYFSIDLDPQSKLAILQLQSDLKARIDGRWVEANQLHITVIHFGILSEVYNQIKALNSALTTTVFERAVQDFKQSCSKLLLQNISLQSNGYASFGPHSNILVLKLKPNQMLINAHSAGLGHLMTFFTNCDVRTPLEFMQDNYNLKFAATFNPHISLARGIRRLPDDLPQPPPELVFMPASFLN